MQKYVRKYIILTVDGETKYFPWESATPWFPGQEGAQKLSEPYSLNDWEVSTSEMSMAGAVVEIKLKEKV